MYFIMSKLDAQKFCKVDFITNFGVSPKVKTTMTTLIEEATTKSQFFRFLETLDPIVLLKMHKYFYWADKKLHSVFFIENKDQIQEDLLFDFKDEEDQQKFINSQSLATKKQLNTKKEISKPKVIEVERSKNKIEKEDLLYGGKFQRKVVNIKDDDDFPDLSGDEMDTPMGTQMQTQGKFTKPNNVRDTKHKKKDKVVLFDDWSKQAEDNLFK